jgi:hypothetical protein
LEESAEKTGANLSDEIAPVLAETAKTRCSDDRVSAAISAALGSNWDQISLVFSRVFVEIPYSTEQGIILEEQGIFSM